MRLVRHSLYNVLGLGLPLLVAVFCIPVLIHKLGNANFGLLTLIWAVVSYFGLFDLGLGRALTQRLSVVLTHEHHQEAGPLVATASLLMAGLGLVAGILMAVLAPWGVDLIQGVSDRQDVIDAVYWMAAAMPAIVLTSGFRGILEARHAFGVINLIRLPMGLFTFLGPVLVVQYGSTNLASIAAVLVAGRIVACGVHAWFALRHMPSAHGKLRFETNLVRPLCVSGGWLTVSNVISPLMSYADRFIVGILVSSSAVAYYATPQEMVSRLGIIPGALTASLFPRFSAHFARPQADFKSTYYRSVLALGVIVLVPVLVLSIWAEAILALWISPEFASQSATALVILSWGMFVACLATIPYTVIQSAGHARLTALFHVFQFPVFIGLLYVLIGAYGVVGAAIAWTMRNLLDAGLLFYAARTYLGPPNKPST